MKKNNIKKVFFAGVLSLAIAFCADAAVTINGQVLRLFQSDGVSQIASGRIGLLIADASNDGLVDPLNTVLTAGNYLGGSGDDLILGVLSTSDISGSGDFGLDFSGTSYNYSSPFLAGDNLWVMWLPTISSSGSTVGGGVSYGKYRSGTVDTDAGADIAWTAPADGATYILATYTTAQGGIASVADFTASHFTAVPEPTTYALLALGGVVVAVAARRRKTA